MGRPLRLLLLSSCLATPVTAQEAPYTPPEPPGRVLVYRGGAPDPEGAVPVYRGSAVTPAWAAPRGEPAEPGTEVVGGRELWLVDRDGGELTACRVERTVNVGQRRIACARRRLPD